MMCGPAAAKPPTIHHCSDTSISIQVTLQSQHSFILRIDTFVPPPGGTRHRHKVGIYPQSPTSTLFIFSNTCLFQHLTWIVSP